MRSARVAAVDFHNHLGRWLTRDGSWMAPDVGAVLALMDACNIETLVNLDGRWGRELEDNLERYDRAHEGRFATFCHLDWWALDGPGTTSKLVADLESAAARGARGLKVWKDLGLNVRHQGRLLLPDDPLLDPVWEAAGELGLPVLVHVADPLAFFCPMDSENERLEDLLRNPGNSQARRGVEHFKRLLEALESIVARHGHTAFVGAHVGCYAENLQWVDGMLQRYPNFHVDIAARIAELGRQPRATARLIAAHPSRVVFGTDCFPLDAEEIRIYLRFLETEDEYFAYSTKPIPPHGRWTISGLGLPEATLTQVYAANAHRLLDLSRRSARDPGNDRRYLARSPVLK